MLTWINMIINEHLEGTFVFFFNSQTHLSFHVSVKYILKISPLFLLIVVYVDGRMKINKVKNSWFIGDALRKVGLFFLLHFQTCYVPPIQYNGSLCVPVCESVSPSVLYHVKFGLQ